MGFSIVFTLILKHAFRLNSMILGKMIPISKVRMKSLCYASNYRAMQ